MSKEVAGLISLVFLAFIVFFSLYFGTNMLATVDDSVDMSGSAYEDTYNASTSAIITSLSFMQFLPYFIGIACLLFVLVGVYHIVK